MLKSEINEKLMEFLIAEGGLANDGTLKSNTKLIESGLFDSIVIVSLFTFCEETFNVEIDLSSIDETVFETVDSLTEYLAEASTA